MHEPAVTEYSTLNPPQVYAPSLLHTTLHTGTVSELAAAKASAIAAGDATAAGALEVQLAAEWQQLQGVLRLAVASWSSTS